MNYIFIQKSEKKNASNKSTKLGAGWNNFMLNDFEEDNSMVFEPEVNIPNNEIGLGWVLFYITVYCYLLFKKKIVSLLNLNYLFICIVYVHIL